MSRRRFVYRETEPGSGVVEITEVGADYTGAPRRAETVTEGIVHGNAVAPDGTDISTKRRRREWMKTTGSADHSDYTNTVAKKTAERAEFYSNGPMDPSRKLDIAQTIHQFRNMARRK